MNLSLWFNKCVSFSTTQSQGAEMITVTTKQINGYSRTAVINVNGQIVKTRTNFQYCAISFRDEDIVTPEGTFVRFARIIARAGTFANLKKSANRRFYCGRGCKLVLINLDTESVYDSAGQTYEQEAPDEEAVTETAPAKAKPGKVNAKSQGFPAAYLGETGSFRPGFDARAKSDIKSALTGKFSGKELVKLTKAQATKLAAARGW